VKPAAYGASPGPRFSVTWNGPRAPHHAAASGSATTASASTMSPRAPRPSINDAVGADALLEARPDLARRRARSHPRGDEPAHVQAVVGVVVVEHADAAREHEVVRVLQAPVDPAQPVAIVHRVHRIEAAEAPDEAASELLRRRQT